MLAAFSRDLISAPFNARRPLFSKQASVGKVEVQKCLREHAAGIAATSSLALQQRIHLDQSGLGLVWTSAQALTARGESVKVIFTGQLRNYKDICSLYANCDSLVHLNDPAQLLLHLYQQEFQDLYGDSSDQPSCLLQCMEGEFAFILYDASCRYTLVARKGGCPLFWGSDNGEGDALIISSVPAYLSPFPPGCAFESQVNNEGEGDSRMLNFSRERSRRGVDTVQRIDSQGHLCGLMFKSVSGQDLVQSALSHAADVY